MKNFYFLRSQMFKLLSQIQGSLINDCDLFKVHNICWGWPLRLLALGAKKSSYVTADGSSGHAERQHQK
jgi:hypothetical protein